MQNNSENFSLIHKLYFNVNYNFYHCNIWVKVISSFNLFSCKYSLKHLTKMLPSTTACHWRIKLSYVQIFENWDFSEKQVLKKLYFFTVKNKLLQGCSSIKIFGRAKVTKNIGHHVWLTEKILGSEWPKMAQMTLKFLCFFWKIFKYVHYFSCSLKQFLPTFFFLQGFFS